MSTRQAYPPRGMRDLREQCEGCGKWAVPAKWVRRLPALEARVRLARFMRRVGGSVVAGSLKLTLISDGLYGNLCRLCRQEVKS